jgi:hypothetical protein
MDRFFAQRGMCRALLLGLPSWAHTLTCTHTQTRLPPSRKGMVVNSERLCTLRPGQHGQGLRGASVSVHGHAGRARGGDTACTTGSWVESLLLMLECLHAPVGPCGVYQASGRLSPHAAWRLATVLVERSAERHRDGWR